MLNHHNIKPILGALTLFLLSVSPVFAQINQPWYLHQIQKMSLEEKIGQLFMVAAYSNKGPEHTKQLEDIIEKHKIGGLIFFQGDPLRQAYMTHYFQSISRTPLLIGMDAEWGLDMRIKPSIKYPFQLTLGSLEGESDSLIYLMGRQIAKQCKAIGVHINFAPVADINNNPSNPIINFRSFGEKREAVARKSYLYSKGMQDEGVMACAKHFPGHGDTDADSHKELPLIPFDKKRLDSLELFPFNYLFQRDLAAVMLAHLQVPSLDNRANRPASLSRAVVTDLLKTEMGFTGLAITDALNMKGVRNYFPAGLGELEAFIAGNHILLFPDNIPLAVEKISTYVKNNPLAMEELNKRVEEILKWKEWCGLGYEQAPFPSNLSALLFPEEADLLKEEVAKASIILVNDKNSLFPVGKNTEIKYHFVILGTEIPQSYNQLLKNQFKNAQITFIKRGSAWENYALVLRGANNAKQHTLVSIHQPKIWNTKSYGFTEDEFKFISQLNASTSSGFVFFCNPYVLNKAKGIASCIVAHEDEEAFYKSAIELMKGTIKFKGKLPVSTLEYKIGSGIVSTSATDNLKIGANHSKKLQTEQLKSIDPILQELTQKRAAPGCRVIVAHQGEIVYDKSHGFHTYENKEPVKPHDLYDLASVTKVAATTLAVMKLYEDKKLSLDDPISKYLVWTRQTNKARITIREILLHESGLPAWLPFYKETTGLFYDSLYKSCQDSLYCIEVADRLFLHQDYKYNMYQQVLAAPLGPKKYLYSDLGMILMKEIIEQASAEPFDWYIKKHLYEPMGLTHITFNPLCCYERFRIVPTQNDFMFRRQLVHGYVHDPGAAMLGGYSGHAGLFASAYEITAIGNMLLNGGNYNGQSILKKETIDYFTKKQSYISRRGLGWDRPELGGGASPASKMASSKAFGHTGFTGTCLWVDPEHQLVYVFLSNRIFPDEENKELIKGNYRTRIQDQIYLALQKS
jgi:beta-N-acetylhexosaminidase